MAQRKPTPIQAEVEIVDEDAAFGPHHPISRAIRRPKVPTRSMMMAERQATAMQFQRDRSVFAIMKTMEVHDLASAETTASILLTNHLKCGFGDDLSEAQEQFYAWMEEIIMHASGAMTVEAAEALREMARECPLPSPEVADWEWVLRVLQEKLLGRR